MASPTPLHHARPGPADPPLGFGRWLALRARDRLRAVPPVAVYCGVTLALGLLAVARPWL